MKSVVNGSDFVPFYRSIVDDLLCLYSSFLSGRFTSTLDYGDNSKGERLIYCNGRSVFIRSLTGSQPNISYSGHAKDTTVAKISPTGYYAASADVSGTVRVWDLAGEDQILKLETKALGGRINDLDWDMESKRIVVGGDGRDRFAAAFSFDTGSSVGELVSRAIIDCEQASVAENPNSKSGHSKVINAVAQRKQRPFRVVTGGDDRTLIFSHGVPYKYAKTLSEHTGFVQDVAFSVGGRISYVHTYANTACSLLATTLPPSDQTESFYSTMAPPAISSVHSKRRGTRVLSLPFPGQETPSSSVQVEQTVLSRSGISRSRQSFRVGLQ